MRKLVVGKNDAGQRLDKFLSKALDLPTSLLYKSIRTKKIKVNRKRAENNTLLCEGDVVQCFLSDEFFEKRADKSSYESITPRLDIVYEDENIMLLNKRPGVSVHEDERGSTSTLITHIIAYLYQKGEYDPEKEHSFAPALCNRIDRNTGGIVIAAKNAETLREMNEQIRLGNVHKSYLCAVHGRMERPFATLRDYLFKNTKTKTVRVLSHPTRGAKEIITAYRTLGYSEAQDLSLLEVDLMTGRTHQIRAHMASIGHPLLGEGKYGVNKNDRELGYSYQALYSYKLRFTVPGGHLAYLNDRTFSVPLTDVRFLEFFRLGDVKKKLEKK